MFSIPYNRSQRYLLLFAEGFISLFNRVAYVKDIYQFIHIQKFEYLLSRLGYDKLSLYFCEHSVTSQQGTYPHTTHHRDFRKIDNNIFDIAGDKFIDQRVYQFVIVTAACFFVNCYNPGVVFDFSLNIYLRFRTG